MFGGSPISVAVPPMFEARICEIRYGTGDTPSRRATDRVTGTIRTTVVTLSSAADRTAVSVASRISSSRGLPRAVATERCASHSKMPVRARMPAMTIMPASRKMTFRSIAANASCWSRMPAATRMRPPSNATTVRSPTSTAISA